MPTGVYDRSGIRFRHATYCGRGPWEHPTETPFNDVEGISRGEHRLAAEVAVAKLSGQDVPSFAHERAFETLAVVAKG